MADDLMREIAPLLAEDGIDLNDPNSIPDMETLQRALNSAVERRNMQLFTPVGESRALALTTLRLFVEAVASDQLELAEAILATAVPESPDNSQATVAGTIGVALDVLDTILGAGHNDNWHCQFPIAMPHREGAGNHGDTVLAFRADLPGP